MCNSRGTWTSMPLKNWRGWLRDWLTSLAFFSFVRASYYFVHIFEKVPYWSGFEHWLIIVVCMFFPPCIIYSLKYATFHVCCTANLSLGSHNSHSLTVTPWVNSTSGCMHTGVNISHLLISPQLVFHVIHNIFILILIGHVSYCNMSHVHYFCAVLRPFEPGHDGFHLIQESFIFVYLDEKVRIC